MLAVACLALFLNSVCIAISRKTGAHDCDDYYYTKQGAKVELPLRYFQASVTTSFSHIVHSFPPPLSSTTAYTLPFLAKPRSLDILPFEHLSFCIPWLLRSTSTLVSPRRMRRNTSRQRSISWSFFLRGRKPLLHRYRQFSSLGPKIVWAFQQTVGLTPKMIGFRAIVVHWPLVL